jgi:predicted ATPase with chaperone activity
MTRVLATDRVFRHGHTSKIVLINAGRPGRGKTEIIKNFSKVNDLLPALTGSDILSFRGRERHTILSARFPGHSATTQHQDIAGV